MPPIKNILVIGASSAIAEAVIQLYAKDGVRFFLAARSETKLESITQDLISRGASEIKSESLDLTDYSKHENLINDAVEFLGTINLVLIAHGSFSKQAECDADFNYALKELEINLLSEISLLTILAKIFEKQKSGSIAVITSVAGVRGRYKNGLYCAAKAGLSTYLQSLRQRLNRFNIHILDIKPGYVVTPMTSHLPRGRLFSDIDPVAKDIYKAIQARKPVLYTPWYWGILMLIVRLIPEFIFVKLKF